MVKKCTDLERKYKSNQFSADLYTMYWYFQQKKRNFQPAKVKFMCKKDTSVNMDFYV